MHVKKALIEFEAAVGQRKRYKGILTTFIKTNAQAYLELQGPYSKWLAEQVEKQEVGGLTDTDLIKHCKVMIEYLSFHLGDKEGSRETD